MIRYITTGVLAALIVASALCTTYVVQAAPVTSAGIAFTQKSHHDLPAWWRHQCRFQRLDGRGGYDTPEVERTIRCATWRWYRGHLPTVLCIAHRESGDDLYPMAKNPRSSASGIFQIVAGTWDGWRDAFAIRRDMFDLSADVFDPRSNVMTALFAMGAYGLHAWGDGCWT